MLMILTSMHIFSPYLPLIPPYYHNTTNDISFIKPHIFTHEFRLITNLYSVMLKPPSRLLPCQWKSSLQQPNETTCC